MTTSTRPVFIQDPAEQTDAAAHLGYAGADWRQRPEWAVWADRYQQEKAVTAVRTLRFLGVTDGFYHYADHHDRRFWIKTDARRAFEYPLFLAYDRDRQNRAAAQQQAGVLDPVPTTKRVKRTRWQAWFALGLAVQLGLLGLLGSQSMGSLAVVLALVGAGLFYLARRTQADFDARSRAVDAVHPAKDRVPQPGEGGDAGDDGEGMFFSAAEAERDYQDDRREQAAHPGPYLPTSPANSLLLGYLAYEVHKLQKARR